MKPTTILIDARALGDKPSGIGIYIYNLVKELHKYPEYHIDLITDICESEEMQALRDADITIHMYGKKVSKSLALFSYYRYVQKTIYKVKPDIFWEGNTMVPIKIRNPHGRMYTTIYDMFPLSDPQHYGRKYPLYFRYSLGKSAKYFDTFIYISNDTKNETEKYFPQIKKKDSFVGYIIVPRMPDIPITDNGDFLYVGNMETRKGTDVLLKAYRIYRQAGGHRGLRLAGKLREAAISELLDRVKQDIDGIEYLGYLSEQDKDKEMAACHAFIFPSKAEGFGIPVIEAMNYYKPIIASDLPTLHEIAGEHIEYVRSSDSRIEEDFAKKMMEELAIPKKEQYDTIIDRYIPENITDRFTQYIQS